MIIRHQWFRICRCHSTPRATTLQVVKGDTAVTSSMVSRNRQPSWISAAILSRLRAQTRFTSQRSDLKTHPLCIVGVFTAQRLSTCDRIILNMLIAALNSLLLVFYNLHEWEHSDAENKRTEDGALRRSTQCVTTGGGFNQFSFVSKRSRPVFQPV